MTQQEVNEDLDNPISTLQEMALESTAVVIGTVRREDELGVRNPEMNARPIEAVALTLEVDRQLTGTPIDSIVFAWDTFVTDGEGRRTLRIERNGIPAPTVGNRLIVFAEPDDAGVAPNITHRPVLLDGIAFLGEDDRVRDGEDNSAIAARLRGMSVDEIAAIIS